MFSKGGPLPWHTKPGESQLDAKIAEVVDLQREGKAHIDQIAHVELEKVKAEV